MIGWWRKDEAQRRAEGTQKLADLMDQYCYAKLNRFPNPDRNDIKIAKLKEKIGTLLSNPEAYDPNLAITSRLHCQNVMLLLNRVDLKEYLPLLIRAGFDPKRFSDQKLGIAVAKDLYSDPDTLKFLQDSGYDFSECDEHGCGMLETALYNYRDEHVFFLLDAGLDPLAIESSNKPAGYVADALIKRMFDHQKYVVPLVKQGIIRCALESPANGFRPDIYNYQGKCVRAASSLVYRQVNELLEQFLEKEKQPASGWTATDLRLCYGLNQLPRFLHDHFWQGHERHLYELYAQMPDHIQRAMEGIAPSLMISATNHAITAYVALPAQHWGRVAPVREQEVQR